MKLIKERREKKGKEEETNWRISFITVLCTQNTRTRKASPNDREI